jgi:hypothetical protein
MAERGYDLAAHRSKGLSDTPDVAYAAAITMGCGGECPQVRAGRRGDWGIPDSKELPPEEFRAVRDLIEVKVKTLLAEL